MMQPDPLDNYAELLQREAQDSDHLLALSPKTSLALLMQWETDHHEADRQRYEADLESEERAVESEEQAVRDARALH